MVGRIECCEFTQLKHTYLKRVVIRESQDATQTVHHTGFQIVVPISDRIRS